MFSLNAEGASSKGRPLFFLQTKRYYTTDDFTLTVREVHER